MSLPTLRCNRALACATVWLTACSEAPTPPQGGDASPPSIGPTLRSSAGFDVSHSRMDSLLSQLTRDVAMALASEPLRHDVFQAIQASPFRENKLHLRTFLSSDGNRLLNAVNSSLRDSRSVSGILDSLIDLEFYMPDDQHRCSLERRL